MQVVQQLIGGLEDGMSIETDAILIRIGKSEFRLTELKDRVGFKINLSGYGSSQIEIKPHVSNVVEIMQEERS